MSSETEHSEPPRDPGGRPSKYRPEFCDRVIELGKIGASRVEIAYELGVDRKTIDNWSVAHAEFLLALTRAKEAEQVWWERKGRDNLSAQSFQSSMWSRSMAARFPDDWRETSRQERTGPDGGPQQHQHSSTGIDEVLGRIARLAARAAESGDPEASK